MRPRLEGRGFFAVCLLLGGRRDGGIKGVGAQGCDKDRRAAQADERNGD